MEISAAKLKELKEKTGAGLLDCKQVLQETNGDIEKAVEILKKKGLAKAAKKDGRAANEGMVAYKISGNKGLLVKVNCETDFVAKTNEFKEFVNQVLELIFSKNYTFKSAEELPEDLNELRKNFIAKLGENTLISEWKFIEGKGKLYPYVHLNKVASIVDFIGDDKNDIYKNIAMQITANNPVAISIETIPENILNEVKEQFRNEAKSTGKPDNVIEKIVQSKLANYYAENVLLEQISIIDESKKVKDIINGVKVNNFIRISM